MDDIDRKILKLLQDNARVSLKTIAENTFLSSPAVSARIEKCSAASLSGSMLSLYDRDRKAVLVYCSFDLWTEISLFEDRMG